MFLEEELNSLDESGEVFNADFKLIRRTKVSVIIVMLPIKLVLELEFLNELISFVVAKSDRGHYDPIKQIQGPCLGLLMLIHNSSILIRLEGHFTQY